MSTRHQSIPDFDAWWDFHQPAETERRFRELLEEVESRDDPPPPGRILELKTQIARARGLQHSFDDANAILDEVEAQAAERSTAAVRAALERGRVLNSSGSPGDARPHFERAWALARETGLDGYAVDAAHMIAIVAPPDEALEWNHQALDLAETSDDPAARRWCGSLHNNIGWTHFERGEHETALHHFERALECRLEQDDERAVRIARWCVAKAHRVLGRIDQALAAQRELLEACTQAGEPDGFVHEEVAECLLARNNPGEAAPHFARAHELLAADPWLREREAERLERLRRLGA